MARSLGEVRCVVIRQLRRRANIADIARIRAAVTVMAANRSLHGWCRAIARWHFCLDGALFCNGFFDRFAHSQMCLWNQRVSDETIIAQFNTTRLWMVDGLSKIAYYLVTF